MSGLREKAFVALAAVLFLGGFLAIAYLDRTHGDIGTEYGPDEVQVTIGEMTGIVEVPQLPEGLYILGAGQSSEMEFNVRNSDPDNDIDTIVFTVPGASMVGSEYEWSEDSEDHEWDSTMDGDAVVLTARDDYPGANYGGSSQYDTAGGIDDALDYDPATNKSEGLTVRVQFEAPSSLGFRSGPDAMDLEVGDLKTENANEKVSVDPFPYPFIVGEDGMEFIVMVLDGVNATLGVYYDGTLWFDSTRASGFKTFSHGMEYEVDDGRTVAVLDMPEAGTIVKPVILPRGGPIGTFSLTIFNFTIENVSDGTVVTVPVETAYTEVPLNASNRWDLDIDSDGALNANDPDIDGDTYVNDEDPAPYDPSVFNTPPSGAVITADRTLVQVGEGFTLSAEAADPDTTSLIYTWKCYQLSSWSKTGKSVYVKAEQPFVPGNYVFVVTVSDGISSQTSTDEIIITVNAKEGNGGGFSTILVVIIAVILIAIVAVLVYIFVVREKGSQEDEEPREMGPEPVSPAPEGPADIAPPTEMASEEEEFAEIEVEETPVSVPVTAAPAAPAPPEESEDVQELEQLIEDLERTEEEISDLCPECGSPLGPTDTSCPSCGTEFELALECPNCGTMVEDNSASCPSCGIQFI